MLQKLKELVQKKDLCVLATVSGSRPHCSLMAYVADEDCRKIYMVTLRDTKKFQNLTQNPAVSLLIDTREEDPGPQRSRAKALTVNGIFQGVERGKQEQVRSLLLERHPHLRDLIGKETAEIFSVRIESLQLLEGATDSYFELMD
jgi:nitroimidazol reductase NimA-like FMN-containing flavoprotein (pyridoxamine 5'-phosphate oxidase superfamily)